MIERLTDIKGIGDKRAAALFKLGIKTPDDLLHFFPRRYLDFTEIHELGDAQHGDICAFFVQFETAPRFINKVRGMTIVSCKVKDHSGTVQLTWFNQPYIASSYQAGENVYLYGRIDVKGKTKRIASPIIYRSNPHIVPIYPLKAGITQTVIKSAIESLLSEYKSQIIETLPKTMREKYHLAPLEDALTAIHFPYSKDALVAAKRRIAFEDMLYLRIAINFMRLKRKKMSGIPYNTSDVLESYQKLLPFELTEGQLCVIREIENDMSKPHCMNRLVQGDVGSGKTAVAMYAMTVAYHNNMQSVLLAPTEILAEQHYTSLCRIAPKEKVCILTGSMSKHHKDVAYAKIANGEYMFITGTHALLQSGIEFHDLGLIVCDEQQRFGVKQRTYLQKKAVTPDVLVMSATPIPRTLALVIYGDLDVSRINGMPRGRQAVKTRIVPPEKRVDMYRYIANEAKSGKQAYIVCPQIESDDDYPIENVKDVYDELSSLLDVKIGLLHGKMKPLDKTAAIDDFRNGNVSLLVSTTVIEVGVDIPSAVNMVIERADMFGLSQLHQLRGRIGRGSLAGYCFLVSERGSECERLSALASTTDGFEIAERDLELRGPGQFLGAQQHGASELGMLSLSCDIETLTAAKEAADLIMTDANMGELVKIALSRFSALDTSPSFN